jgi:trypsin
LKVFLNLLFLIILISCSQTNQSKNSQFKKDFIIGGRPVDPAITDTSYIVHFSDGCAGSIINEKWILSAGHCEDVFPSELTAGGVDLRANDRIILKIKRTILHPGFKSYEWGSKNDFALIELETAIDFKKTKLRAISLATPEYANAGGVNEGVKATVLGWGITTYDDEHSPEPSDILLSVTIPLVSLERANSKESYEGLIDHSMLAAGYDKGGKDSCGGDSGGPLVVLNPETKKLTQIGIVSFGHGCGLAYKYGIYANVAFGFKWITETISK